MWNSLLVDSFENCIRLNSVTFRNHALVIASAHCSFPVPVLHVACCSIYCNAITCITFGLLAHVSVYGNEGIASCPQVVKSLVVESRRIHVSFLGTLFVYSIRCAKDPHYPLPSFVVVSFYTTGPIFRSAVSRISVLRVLSVSTALSSFPCMYRSRLHRLLCLDISFALSLCSALTSRVARYILMTSSLSLLPPRRPYQAFEECHNPSPHSLVASSFCFLRRQRLRIVPLSDLRNRPLWNNRSPSDMKDSKYPYNLIVPKGLQGTTTIECICGNESFVTR